MRAVIGLLMVGLLGSSQAALAQTSQAAAKPAHTPEDFAQAMKAAPCPEGQVRNEDGGDCRPEIGTRGFNLGAKARPHAPAPVARPAPGPSLLDDLLITFHSGSAQLTPDGQAEVKSFGAAMTMPWLAKRRFEIAGHTDASGSSDRNLALSQARAESVLNFLVANGVDRGRLQARGYGSDGLALPNAPRDPANRRVEARSLN